MIRPVSSDEAVSIVDSRQSIYIQGAAATPQSLVDALVRRADELSDVQIYHLHTEGNAPYATPGLSQSFHVNAFFIGANCRQAVNDGRADFIPAFLSEIPILIRKEIIPIDIAFVHVSPPDKHGFCSLGISVEATLAAIEMADHVIAQVNRQMPRTHGDGLIHIENFDTFVEVDDPIYEVHPRPQTSVEKQIGKYAASLIEDRATLQMGIGSIPDAILAELHDHKDLGIHTEMFSDGVMDLVHSGVVTNRYKKKHKKTLVTSFLMGTRKLYDFVDDNPQVRVLDVQYVNDPAVIRKNPKVTAINSAIEVDLSGQVCADSIGTTMYSGVGGQMDFIRGAALSEDGKPIIALPSVTKTGVSRIVPYLKQGAGVVTTRAHVHYVVTEYGIANLYGKSIQARAKELISIAHPDHQEFLEKEAYDRFNKA